MSERPAKLPIVGSEYREEMRLILDRVWDNAIGTSRRSERALALLYLLSFVALLIDLSAGPESTTISALGMTISVQRVFVMPGLLAVSVYFFVRMAFLLTSDALIWRQVSLYWTMWSVIPHLRDSKRPLLDFWGAVWDFESDHLSFLTPPSMTRFFLHMSMGRRMPDRKGRILGKAGLGLTMVFPLVVFGVLCYHTSLLTIGLSHALSIALGLSCCLCLGFVTALLVIFPLSGLMTKYEELIKGFIESSYG